MTTLAQADPVLVALADAHPDLDDIRWRVTLPDGTREYIAGERVETEDPTVLRFVLTDLSVREFGAGEWTSLTGMPGKPAPDLRAIVGRLFAFGLADQQDILRPYMWLQAQPEWIENERRLAESAEDLRQAERIHVLRKMGL